ncbi:MAG: MotA/TolQ/ExbB proton channel family protein [SAR324 cluster bacterium]|nr:MotA/TolQ/ExbB proton channel family protein [SAR324 cluster bacterium]
MIIVAHILGFALIFIASSFDFMNFSLKASNLQFFVDLPSLIIVLLPTIYYAATVHGWGIYGNSWKALLGSVDGIPKNQLEPTRLCLRDLGNLSLIWGILGTFLGVILLLQESSGVVEQWGPYPAIAVSLITLFYGILFYMLCLVSKSRIERRITD